MTTDTICTCNHWFEEHDSDGECAAPDCACRKFEYDAAASTPDAIAWRGGDPDKWPDHMKQAIG